MTLDISSHPFTKRNQSLQFSPWSISKTQQIIFPKTVLLNSNHFKTNLEMRILLEYCRNMFVISITKKHLSMPRIRTVRARRRLLTWKSNTYSLCVSWPKFLIRRKYQINISIKILSEKQSYFTKKLKKIKLRIINFLNSLQKT